MHVRQVGYSDTNFTARSSPLIKLARQRAKNVQKAAKKQ